MSDNAVCRVQVRGKVATCLAASATQMTPEQWHNYPSKQLLVVAGKLVSDNTPEARDSAKSLISILKGAFEDAATARDHEASLPMLSVYCPTASLSSAFPSTAPCESTAHTAILCVGPRERGSSL